MQDRITFPREIWEQGKYFFMAPESYDEKVASKKWNEDAVKVISAFSEALGKGSISDASAIKDTLESTAAQYGLNPGKVMQALRLAVTGTAGGPDLMMIMEILGIEEVQSRISFALKTLKVKVA
jgi:glutamyl-tRNA synthetase